MHRTLNRKVVGHVPADVVHYVAEGLFLRAVGTAEGQKKSK